MRRQPGNYQKIKLTTFVVVCVENMKEDIEALKELRSLEDEVITPADQGNATVVMKSSDYHEKIRGMLDDTTTYITESYQRIPQPPRKPGQFAYCYSLRNRELPKNVYNGIRLSGSCYMGYPKHISHRFHLSP